MYYGFIDAIIIITKITIASNIIIFLKDLLGIKKINGFLDIYIPPFAILRSIMLIYIYYFPGILE
jgi:hypothetical protein